ncbi:MAG: hypothetical protein JO087_03985 [Actinobacteria bacterium]|nr:hypothetical protein [Actinomycetota bacterium]
MKPFRLAAAAASVALLVLPVALMGPARADGPAAVGPDGVISGQAESYAMRVEYDLPLPAGSGTIAHVSGEARRSKAGENAKGIAAAPTEMDAVVGGKYIDPQGTGHPVRSLPQTECFYPGSLVDTHFFFPTDTQGETAGLPRTGYATAQCGAGPSAELHSSSVSVGGPGTASEALGPVLTAGQVGGDALAHTVKDTLDASSASRASNVSIGGGAVKIGSVVASGHSATNGKAGGATSRAAIALNDIDAGGVTFSVASAITDGKETVDLTVAGQTVPVDSSAAQSTLAAANAAIKALGCSLTLVGSPAEFPQGFLFSRPQPELGVKPDGTLGASYRGGLLVVCDMPRSVTDNLDNFSPERAQVLVGFAYTSASAHAEVGGFGLGDLADSTPGAGSGVLGSTFSAAPATGSGTGTLPSLSATPPSATAPAATAAPTTRRAAPAAAILPYRMGAGAKWFFGLLGVLVWAFLTHLGARRFLAATAACPGDPDGDAS